MRAYAFVDFCTPDAAAACIESGIMVNGKTVSVEEKRPNMARNGSRGGNIGGRDGRRDGGGRGGGRMDGRRESNRNYGGRDGQRVGNRGVADRERPGGKGTGRF